MHTPKIVDAVALVVPLERAVEVKTSVPTDDVPAHGPPEVVAVPGVIVGGHVLLVGRFLLTLPVVTQEILASTSLRRLP